MRRSMAWNRGCKDALFERDAFGQPVAVRPASSRTPRFRAIGREVMACHDRMRLAWQVSRHPGRGKNQATEIGRASCRERVCQYVDISVVDVSLTKKTLYCTHQSSIDSRTCRDMSHNY